MTERKEQFAVLSSPIPRILATQSSRSRVYHELNIAIEREFPGVTSDFELWFGTNDLGEDHPLSSMYNIWKSVRSIEEEERGSVAESNCLQSNITPVTIEMDANAIVSSLQSPLVESEGDSKESQKCQAPLVTEANSPSNCFSFSDPLGYPSPFNHVLRPPSSLVKEKHREKR